MATANATQTGDAPSPILSALACALTPASCLAAAAVETGERASVEAANATALAAAYAGGAGFTIANAIPTADDVRDIITASTDPIAETASATRYVAVAVTIVVVALVALALLVYLRGFR